jgi:hypothetical protein
VEPTGKDGITSAATKPACLVFALGGAGIIVAAFAGTVGLLSIGADPLKGLALLVLACLGVVRPRMAGRSPVA